MKKFNLTVLLTVLMSMVGTKASAYDIAVKNADGVTIYYNFININGELAVTYSGNGNDYSGNVVIPESVMHDGDTCSVTTIGDRAFSGCISLASVDIPSSVTNIGDRAFSGCISLASVDIPSSVTNIGNGAFYSCSNLTSVNIPNSVTAIGDWAFYNCSSLTSVDIPYNVTSIGDWAFYNCSSLISVNIPNSVTNIGDWAFYNCSSLISVDIPNSVTNIGYMTFCKCSSLEKIIVEDGNPNYDSRENCNAIIHTADNELIIGCKNTIIPNSVTTIGSGAFYNCSGLTSMDIPNSVTNIGNSAFGYCNSLTSVTIGNSVTTIGDYAFYNCSSLTSVDIPNSVTNIGNYTFCGCNSLTSVTIGNSVTDIGNNAFYDCNSLTTLYSLNTTPPTLINSFPPSHYTSVNVYVPQEALATYKSANEWTWFENLYAIDDVSTAVTQPNANADAETVTVYTLEGRVQTMKKADLQSLPKGIYIVDGKKVVVK